MGRWEMDIKSQRDESGVQEISVQTDCECKTVCRRILYTLDSDGETGREQSRVSTTQGNAKKCGKLDELVERDDSLADELCFS